jgi:hypothetical protein
MPRARDLRAAVGVERVVCRKLLRHVFVVVPGGRLEAGGQGVEPGGLRRQLTRVGVGAAHDQRQRIERRIGQLVLLEKRVERAPLAVVAELDVRHVVRDRALALGDGHHLTRRHEEERRLTVDEAADEPRTRDTVDACFFASHPFHGSLLDV